MPIKIVGLGPGDSRQITREAWETLSQAGEVYLRTRRHPAADELPQHLNLYAFDDLYETAEAFEDVYHAIVSRLLELGRHQEVVYAVPGDPLVGEATVLALTARGPEAGVSIEIISGMSFLEPVLKALANNEADLALDGMDGVQIFDAISVARRDFPSLNVDRPVFLGQVYSRLLAGELKQVLTAVYPAEHEVALVHGAGTPAETVEKLPLYQIDHSDQIAHLTTLVVPPRSGPGDLTALAEAIATLRGPDGCPWDQEQTPQSLRGGLIEETAELLDAIDGDNADDIAEELGDVLLHVVMQTQMAAEEERFTLPDVIQGIVTKLVRRHPHVWGDVSAADSETVKRNWEVIKADEKKKRDRAGPVSILAELPAELPALARALKIQKRVKKVGFDWKEIEGVYDKLEEEIKEVQTAMGPVQTHAEIGDLLFAAVNLARWLKVDPEVALRDANHRFIERFQTVEELAGTRPLVELDAAELNRLWDEAKRRN